MNERIMVDATRAHADLAIAARLAAGWVLDSVHSTTLLVMGEELERLVFTRAA